MTNTRSQAAANTRKLIDWAVDAVGKPLPEPVRRRAAIILSDDIGAMVAGSLETQVAKAREQLLKTSSVTKEATVLARGAPTVPVGSASCEEPLPPQPAKTTMKKSTTPSLSVS